MTHRTTVKEIRAMLECLPDDLPVEFAPITSAFLGCNHPLRFGEMNFYDDDGHQAMPTDEGAHLSVYLMEDDRELK